MAITITLEDSTENDGGVGEATQTSGSFTPENNCRLFVFATCVRDAHSTAFSWSITDSVDGATGWTTDTTTSAYNFAGSNGYAISSALFYKDFTTGHAARTVTVDAFATGDTGHYSLVTFSVTGHNASNVFRQARVTNGADVNPTSSSASGTLTLGTAPLSGNAVVAMFGVGGDAVQACATPTDYTVIASQDNIYSHVGAFYHLATTTAAVTTSDLGDDVGNWAGIIMELNDSDTAFINRVRVNKLRPAIFTPGLAR